MIGRTPYRDRFLNVPGTLRISKIVLFIELMKKIFIFFLADIITEIIKSKDRLSNIVYPFAP